MSMMNAIRGRTVVMYGEILFGTDADVQPSGRRASFELGEHELETSLVRDVVLRMKSPALLGELRDEAPELLIGEPYRQGGDGDVEPDGPEWRRGQTQGDEEPREQRTPCGHGRAGMGEWRR